MSRLRLPAIALTFLISTNAWADLRTYDLDPQYQQEIYAALKLILAPTNGPQLGRIELLPSGQLLIWAETQTLDQVEAVLQTIRDSPAAPAARVELRYWAVLGTRAAIVDPPGTPTPNALNAVLGELEREHGDLNFRVIGTAALTSASGQHAEVSGMALEVEQTAFVQGDVLNASIEMSVEGRQAPIQFGEQGVRLTTFGEQEFQIGSLEVRTALRRGEFVVLGQSDRVGGGLDGPVFFIVHWPEAQAR